MLGQKVQFWLNIFFLDLKSLSKLRAHKKFVKKSNINPTYKCTVGYSLLLDFIADQIFSVHINWEFKQSNKSISDGKGGLFSWSYTLLYKCWRILLYVTDDANVKLYVTKIEGKSRTFCHIEPCIIVISYKYFSNSVRVFVEETLL